MLHHHDTLHATYATTGVVGTTPPPSKAGHMLEPWQSFSWLVLSPSHMSETNSTNAGLRSKISPFPFDCFEGFGLLPRLAAIRKPLDPRCATIIVFSSDSSRDHAVTCGTCSAHRTSCPSRNKYLRHRKSMSPWCMAFAAAWGSMTRTPGQLVRISFNSPHISGMRPL